MTNRFEHATTIQEVIGQAMGLASMCWNPRPEGEFDSRTASGAVDEAVERIEQLHRERLVDALRLGFRGMMSADEIRRRLDT